MKCEVCEGEVKLWSGKPRCWSCGHTSEAYDPILIEETEKKLKEIKAEERKLPNYDRPFCWACREHSRYRGRHQGEGYSDLVRVCVTCNSKMYKPSDMDYVGRNWEKSCIFFAIIITVTALNYSPKPLSIFIIALPKVSYPFEWFNFPTKVIIFSFFGNFDILLIAGYTP